MPSSSIRFRRSQIHIIISNGLCQTLFSCCCFCVCLCFSVCSFVFVHNRRSSHWHAFAVAAADDDDEHRNISCFCVVYFYLFSWLLCDGLAVAIDERVERSQRKRTYTILIDLLFRHTRNLLFCIACDDNVFWMYHETDDRENAWIFFFRSSFSSFRRHCRRSTLSHSLSIRIHIRFRNDRCSFAFFLFYCCYARHFYSIWFVFIFALHSISFVLLFLAILNYFAECQKWFQSIDSLESHPYWFNCSHTAQHRARPMNIRLRCEMWSRSTR